LSTKKGGFTMKNIFVTLCLGVALYTGVTLFFAEEPVYTTQTITVHSGDTLWSIADEFRHESEDIRDVIDRIYDANGLTKAYIYPGQVLKVPVRE
jgi:LysM repeat protein